MDSMELSKRAVRQPAIIVDFTRVDRKDPHRYVLGFYKGFCGSEKTFGGTEYDEGYSLGALVREGKESMPDWCFSPDAFDGDTIFDHTDSSIS
ncbi:MAG: hypothetical protein VXX11_07120 [Planctomycetota bacterium]|nr:hypothetical protein [Planctomycetota bacterium]